MRILLTAVTFVAIVAPIARGADDPEVKDSARKVVPAAYQEFTLGQMTPTPEMWIYQQQLRRYSDPKAAVRRRAEFEADQRQARLAAQRWFGYSNSRPVANPTPYTGTYSPAWTSNSPYANQWRGVNPATIVVPLPPRGSSGYGLW